MGALAQLWERHVLNRTLERVLDVPEAHAERRLALAPTEGEVLEIGIGTGLNLPCYPPSVTRLSVVTREPEINPRARARAEARGIALEHFLGDAEALPFSDARFDTVVCTLLLCSVGDPTRAAAEMRRVLRPGGKLLFLEHVIAPGALVRFGQHAFAPLSRLINCGCSPARDTAALLRHTFAVDELVEHDLAPLPLLYRHLIRGAAHRR